MFSPPNPYDPNQSARVNLSGSRILIVEDAPETQRWIDFVLRKASADTAVAGDGRSAVEKVAASQCDPKGFDVILMDVCLPEMDGKAATEQIRKDGYKGVIIALTAGLFGADESTCLAAGCNSYLMKPVERDVLVNAIHQALNAKTGAAIPSV